MTTTVSAFVTQAALQAALAKHRQKARGCAHIGDYMQADHHQAKADAVTTAMLIRSGDIAREDILKGISLYMAAVREKADKEAYSEAGRHQSQAAALVDLLECEAGCAPSTWGDRNLKMRILGLENMPIAA